MRRLMPGAAEQEMAPRGVEREGEIRCGEDSSGTTYGRYGLGEGIVSFGILADNGLGAR